MTEPGAKPRAGAIKPDPAQMHVVHCPNCSRAIGEVKVQPGSLNRYRCKRCGEWTWLVGVAAIPAPVVDVEAQTV
jgi:predicted RNA-binding Zn-ribbon protein involved in translation (DUF1610 family)